MAKIDVELLSTQSSGRFTEPKEGVFSFRLAAIVDRAGNRFSCELVHHYLYYYSRPQPLTLSEGCCLALAGAPFSPTETGQKKRGSGGLRMLWVGEEGEGTKEYPSNRETGLHRKFKTRL